MNRKGRRGREREISEWVRERRGGNVRLVDK